MTLVVRAVVIKITTRGTVSDDKTCQYWEYIGQSPPWWECSKGTIVCQVVLIHVRTKNVAAPSLVMMLCHFWVKSFIILKIKKRRKLKLIQFWHFCESVYTCSLILAAPCYCKLVLHKYHLISLVALLQKYNFYISIEWIDKEWRNLHTQKSNQCLLPPCVTEFFCNKC